MLKKIHLHFIFMALAALVFASCQRKATDSSKFIFRYNEPSGISSLDPAFSRDKSSIWATSQLYNGLLQMNDSLQAKPCIAKFFTVDSTHTRYTFVLRDDVYFHKNKCFGKAGTRRVVAQDFVYSFGRLRDENIASPGRWTLDIADSIWAENDTLLFIKLSQPFAPFAGVLTMKYCSVVPQEAIDFYGSTFSTNPVGTGPFRFVVWNEKLILNKNEAYFEVDEKGEKLPYADGVAVRFITDQQAAFLEFLKGNLDLLYGLDAGYKDEILTPEGNLSNAYTDKYVLQKQAYLNTEYLIFNVDTANTSSEIAQNIRLAINLGINRKTMMRYLRNNIGLPATGGIIPAGLPGNILGRGHTYQPEKAKQLIAEAKKDQAILPKITLTTVANFRDLCEYIQSEMGKLGLAIQVDVIPAANLREQKSQGSLSFFRASWIADYPDAENYLSLFYGPNRSPYGPNYSRFYNAQFDAWYTEAKTATAAEVRIALYQKMDSLVVAEAPIVPLYYDEVVRIYPKQYSGLKGNAMNMLDLRYVR